MYAKAVSSKRYKKEGTMDGTFMQNRIASVKRCTLCAFFGVCFALLMLCSATALCTQGAEHSLGAWEILSVPTENEPGTIMQYCTVCDTSEVRSINTEISMTLGQSTYTYNGLPQTMDAIPTVRNDRIMLPLRYIAENFDCEVIWDGQASIATMKNHNVEVNVTVGSAIATVNGEEVTLDSPAFIENNRTFIPVRFIAESLGCIVLWDAETSTATILDAGTTVSKILDVPYIYQKIDYPNGCESVSTVMALQDLGMDIDVETFISKYLDMGARPVVGGIGPDPEAVYCGNPRLQSGWGCYSPVIVNALNKFMDKSKYTVQQFYGKSLEELCKTYIDNDIPVILWATVNMVDSSASGYYRHWTTAEGKKISYNAKLHCLLLVGYDEESYYFNDPLKMNADGPQYTEYSKAAVEKAYSILKQQCVVIVPGAQ